MPREPERARRLEQNYNIVTLVPGWLKNLIIDIADQENTSVQQWIATVLLDAARRHQKIPELKDGARLPTPAEILHGYLTGQQTLKPCGRTDCTPDPINLNTHTYCNDCGCRLN